MSVRTSRRQFLGALAASAVSVAADRKQPNVILLMTDDQGYGDLACHGNKHIKTPALDRLHARSIRFTDFHVSPTCAPTRASLLTGRYCNATGVWHTIMGRSLLRPGEVTMADCFRASGYRTGIFGKWHLGDNYPCRPQDRGFDEVLIHGGGGVWQTPDYFGNDYFDDTYFHKGKPRQFTGHCTDVWFENARAFMKQSAAAGKPFFCYIPTNAPHGPMWSPASHEAQYVGTKGLKQPGFYGMISHIDENVGRLTAFLEEQKLAENTILIFMTDNGTAAGANVFNASMRGSKGSPYEGGHRVPFFLSWPGGDLGPAREVPELTSHIDVLPTMMELCGLRRPAGPALHGVSLVPLLRGKRKNLDARAIVVDSQRLEELVKWRQAAVMEGSWRLVFPGAGGEPVKGELYDIATDPSQSKDVAQAHPDVVRRLTSAYEKWWSQVTPKSDQPVRIHIGSAAANPVTLTAHDWHGEGALQVWNQGGIRKGPAANGIWTLQVERPGTYRFELRRWPREAGVAIRAGLPPGKNNRETTPGTAIPINSARISIAGTNREAAVRESDLGVPFDVRLNTGPADLQTWFRDETGGERGAYYVYVTRL